jgi:aminoacrylate hydrolase
MPNVDVGGASVFYETRGDGPPMLMLLPQSTGPKGLAMLLDTLATQHRVITYHQRGSGQSSAWSQPMSMADQAADAALVLAAVDAKAAHVFCHSTGCGIGVALIARQAHQLRSLVMTNPWTWGDSHLSGMQRLRIAAAKALSPSNYARFNAALLFPPDFRRIHSSGFEQITERALTSPHNAADIERRLEAILAFDSRPLLRHIDLPSVVIGAADDQLMPAWFAQEAAAEIRNSTLHLLDGGGHMLTETRTDEVLKIVLEHALQMDS